MKRETTQKAPFFRHEFAKLTASLSRRVGWGHLESVEDAVQTALLTAVETWGRVGEPDDPSAWLYRVAYNRLMESLRTATRRHQLLERSYSADELHAEPAGFALAAEIPDELLRMLFVCCDEAIPLESQLALALRTLCGFDVREVAARLFISEANAYKRLARAREKIRELAQADNVPRELPRAGNEADESRLPAVRHVLYLLFTEGYLSHDHERAIRQELCSEALRLAQILAQHPVGQSPETSALVALLQLHSARLPGRQGEIGVLLLEEQDRSLWDTAQIGEGLRWLNRSAAGDQFSRYHAEAAIAAEHCMAPSLRETRWEKIEELYELLERIEPSPLHRLNRALAAAESRGANAGLLVLKEDTPPSWLQGSYMWAAVLADLYRRAGEGLEARDHERRAVDLAPSPAIQALLKRRFSGKACQ